MNALCTCLILWLDGRVGVIAAGRGREFNFNSSYYIGLGVLVVLMIVALVKAYRMWEEINDVEEPDSPTDLLATFEAAHAAGEIDDEELERVRQKLAGAYSDLDRPSESDDGKAIGGGSS